jgi:hypothetical protein
MMKENQPEESRAIELFNEQLNKLTVIRGLGYKSPEFITWRNTVTDLFQRFLRPDSSHFVTFRDIRFRGPAQVLPARRISSDYRGPLPTASGPWHEDIDQFRSGYDLAVAEGCIRGAIETLRNSGIHREGTERNGLLNNGEIKSF